MSLVQFSVFFLCLSCSTAQFVALNSTLQESGRELACPGEEVTYRCEINGTSLTWIVEPYTISGNGAPPFFASDPPGKSFVSPPEAVRVLVQNTPTLISELILRPSGGLENTTVICRSDVEEEQLPYRLSVPPRPPPTVTVSGADGVEGKFAFAIAEWEDPGDDDIAFYRLVSYLDGGRQPDQRVVDRTSTALIVFRNVEGTANISVQVFTVNKCGQKESNGSEIITKVVAPRKLVIVEDVCNCNPVAASVGIAAFVIGSVFCIVGWIWISRKNRKNRCSSIDIVEKCFGRLPERGGDGDGGGSSKVNMDKVDKLSLLKCPPEVISADKDGTVRIKIVYDEDAIKAVAASKKMK